MERDLITSLSEKIQRSSDIDAELFVKYKVKRGLRNADDSGVLVGLSNISNVVGYEKRDGEIIPVEGRLIYRGIPIEELSTGFQSDGRHGFEETTYLILTGKLPDRQCLEEFSSYMSALRDLPMAFIKTNMISNRGSDIMNMLARNILFLYTFDKKSEDTSRENLVQQSLSLI
ncbi:MAG: citrate synthase, partial [Bacteroidia bacterium]